MRKHFVAALLSLTLFSAFAQKDKRLKNIEKELNELMKTANAPGFAVAVVEKDKMIWSAGFGYRDYEKKIPADANTLYAIGSSTKAFTSAVLGQLQKDGKLSFTDSPLKYIPELQFYNNDLNGNITIEDLMSHRTGLPRHDYSWYLFPTHSRDSIIKRIKYQEPFTGLRQQWHYNNFMFTVQGVIAEKITGKSWEDNVRELFLAPLGMTRSNLTIAEMKAATNAALGYDLKKGDIITKMDYYDIAAMGPAGSINSSANDIANWLIMWINKGKFNGKEVLPESYINDAMSSHAVIRGGLPSKEFPGSFMANYGYGWMMSSYKGHYRVEHGGNIDGFSASVAFFPAEEIGIVVLTNQNSSPIPSLVRNVVADRMLNAGKTDWNAELVKDKKQEKAARDEAEKTQTREQAVATTPSHPLDDYTGLFTNPGYGTFEIVRKNDSLFAEFRQTRFYLKHKRYDIFAPYEAKREIDTSDDTDGMFMNFIANDAGDIAGVKVKMEQTLDHALEFKRRPKQIAVSGDILSEYVGDYEIMGMTVKVSVKDGKLYMFVPGQPEYELAPTSKTMYVVTALDGYKAEFVAGKDGKVKELVLHQPNGKFTAVKK